MKVECSSRTHTHLKLVLSTHSKCYLRLIVFPFASPCQILACDLFSHLNYSKKILQSKYPRDGTQVFG